MAQKKAHEVENFLKNGLQSYEILLIYGPDKGLISEYAAVFAKNCGINSKDPFAVTKIDGENLDKDPSALIDEAQTIGFFGGKRLIWVSYAGSGNKGGFSEALKFLLQQPLADCFILIEAGDLKKGAALRKIIEEAPRAVALPCYGDEGQAIQKLIDNVLQQFHCTITEEARSVLQANLGSDRLISRAELEKLCLYSQINKHITLEDVKNSVSDERALSQVEITDAVICGDLPGFNQNFDRQIAGGIPSFLILLALMRQFQQLQIFRFAMEKERKNVNAIITAARPPVFFRRKKILEQALTLWTSVKIDRAMEKLHKTLLDSRKNNELGLVIIRQNLLTLTIEAARSK